MPYALANDGTRIHYEVFGRRSAPAVLMIQGLGADKHGWDMQRFILAAQYYVIAFDNRGAGRSDKPFGAYTMQQMTDDAVAVLDAVDVRAAHVVGASMGGVIGQIMAVATGARAFALLPDNASISRLVVTADRWIVRAFNDVSHLEA